MTLDHFIVKSVTRTAETRAVALLYQLVLTKFSWRIMIMIIIFN